jgi:tRNA modification GTPase
MNDLDDTIAAIATATGEGGLAVIRVSGSDALAVADLVFAGQRTLAECESHTLHHGWACARPMVDGKVGESGAGDIDAAASREVAGAPAERRVPPQPSTMGRAQAQPERIDEVVAAVFRGPRSYTGEDIVELSCHGGRLSAARLLDALLAAGARLAGPGEFTLRAFLNGRMDLARAEAVADLIHAETEAARALALDQLAGSLSRRVDSIADRLTDALAEVEARVDFAEDVGGVEVPPHVVQAIDQVAAELDQLLESGAWGRAVREGARLPLVGRPNVGKSSLFNALLGESRAIVTPRPGTTRDRVSEPLEIAGVRVVLSDTAGLREAGDEVEAIGVERTRAALDESRAALWVVDGSAPLEPDDLAASRSLAGKRVVAVLNKRDLGNTVTAERVRETLSDAAWCAVVEASAASGDGVGEVRARIAEVVGVPGAGPLPGAIPALANPRHSDALSHARAALARAQSAAAAGEPGELVSSDLRDALESVGHVTGRNVGPEVLDRIFSRFCIGK